MDPLTYLFRLEQFGIKFGLDNISTLVARLGHPERTFRSVHIAGTNGKGSVTAMVDAALRAAGHDRRATTSPHLVSVTERFVIDGRPVTERRSPLWSPTCVTRSKAFAPTAGSPPGRHSSK
jgi:dihydrofolate synthase/folylpolyglutamate synthase